MRYEYAEDQILYCFTRKPSSQDTTAMQSTVLSGEEQAVGRKMGADVELMGGDLPAINFFQ